MSGIGGIFWFDEEILLKLGSSILEALFLMFFISS